MDRQVNEGVPKVKSKLCNAWLDDGDADPQICKEELIGEIVRSAQ